MLRATWLAAALLAAFPGGATLFSSSASANEMRADDSWGSGAWGNRHQDSYGSPIGVNRYCPPGEIPHSYPNGNGVRCQTLDGDWR